MKRYVEEDRGHGTPCWIWQGSTTKKVNGYGQLRPDGHGTPMVVAHRWMYEREVGPIPEGKQLDHLCRQRLCCNPDHLEPVTPAVNRQRGITAKLDAEKVREIRALEGETPATALAEKFGVAVRSIYHIWRGETWRAV